MSSHAALALDSETSLTVRGDVDAFSWQRAYSRKRQLGIRLVSWPRALHIHGSVLPRLLIPVFLSSLWGLLLVIIAYNFKYTQDGKEKDYVSQMLINPIALAVISGVVSLTLVFRNNSAFEKYTEGRRIWGTIHTNCRNLIRIVRTCATQEALEQQKAFLETLRLVLDCVKQHMHSPKQYKSVSEAWLCGKSTSERASWANELHSQTKSVLSMYENVGGRPLDGLLILAHAQFNILQAKAGILAPAVSGAMAQFHSINEAVSQMDRIVNTPIPPAFQIHTFQALTLYLIILPFQILDLKYFVPFVCACAAFTLYGVAAIGSELMNPFGVDLNDIKLDSLTHLADCEMKSNASFPFAYTGESYSWAIDAMLPPALELPEFSPNSSTSQN